MEEETLKAIKLDSIQSGIEVTVEEITPQIANRYLEMNEKNRPPKANHVTWLSDQMKTNSWFTTHQGIAFDSDGHLRDGQHRLYAVIKSMTNQTFIVVRGLDPETFSVMDTGKNRNAGDVLAIEGYEMYSQHLAGVIRIVLEWDLGLMRHIGKGHRITNLLILRYMKKNEGLVDVAKFIVHLSSQRKGLLSPNIAASFVWIFKDLKDCDLETAKYFFERIYTGANLNEHTPELYLRNWLLQDRLRERRATRQEKMATIIMGWNFHRTNTPVARMWSWKKSKDAFPTPV